METPLFPFLLFVGRFCSEEGPGLSLDNKFDVVSASEEVGTGSFIDSRMNFETPDNPPPLRFPLPISVVVFDFRPLS